MCSPSAVILMACDAVAISKSWISSTRRRNSSSFAIARRFALPRRVLTILEGEGLVNDATALILFSFAVGAVTMGRTFSLPVAVGEFLVIVAGEIVWGLFIGWGALVLRRWANEPRVEMVFALLTPFAAFWIPESLGGSGVLATVVSGLYVSWNGPRFISPATRLQGFFVWDLVIYLIEGLVFLITGLQARVIAEVASLIDSRFRGRSGLRNLRCPAGSAMRTCGGAAAKYGDTPRHSREE
jgi:NhaP-type Na+/H+ or K+/H+ antiporter